MGKASKVQSLSEVDMSTQEVEKGVDNIIESLAAVHQVKEQLFEPVSDKLVCEPLDQEEMSDGGIIMPELSEQKTLKARVLYAGKGFWAAPGLFIETTMKPGDVILYQRFAAQTFELDGKDYQIVQERDVLSRLNLTKKD